MSPLRAQLSIGRIALLCLLTALPLRAAEFYASPSGTPNGNGSISSPWNLATAFDKTSTIRPGDTLWLRGGTYRECGFTYRYVSKLAGTAASPITVRAYGRERATIDGNIRVQGAYVTFWDLEVYSSIPGRTTSQNGSFPTTWWLNNPCSNQIEEYCVSGMDIVAPGTKVINCVVHDSIGGGFGVNTPASGSEVYGSLTYYNGWQGGDRGHGHGFYVQNGGLARTVIQDNISFANYSEGLQVTSAEGLGGFVTVEGNMLFINSILGKSGQFNLLFGSWQGFSRNPIIVSNMVYDFTTKTSSVDFYLGYTGGLSNAVVTGNYVTTSVMWGPLAGGISTNGNTFLKNVLPTTGTKIFVRPNKYEAGRANIAIYNWALASTVAVDVSGIGLQPGDTYELRNAQNYYGDILTGTYTGGTITVPMTGRFNAAPNGRSAPASTFPRFGAFVIRKTGTGSTPVNSAPTITNPGNRTINANTSTGPLNVTIGDAQTASGSLTLTASSSNTALVPTSAIALGGSGANRTVTVTPAANQSGTATITLRVSDGSLSTTASFTVTVNAVNVNTAPTISNPGNRAINVNTSTGPLSVTVGDAQTASGSLTLTASSSNTALVPTSAIVLGGSGANRTVTVTPVFNQSGTATITLRVSDGSLSATTSFTVTVNAASEVNPSPIITIGAAPIMGGTCSGGGVMSALSRVTVSATPNTGYSFANWSERGVEVSTSASYTFTAISSRTLVANFVPTGGAGALPSPWQTRDIGSTGATGAANYNNGVFAVAGAGADIWDYADRFQYVYQSASSDCEIRARVTSQQSTDPWAKSGIMIREVLNDNSVHVSLFVTPDNGVVLQHRRFTGGVSTSTVETPGVAGAPRWLRLVRTGQLFTGYSSTDGANWTTVGSISNPMGVNLYIGLAVSSHRNGSLSTATISNVTAIP